MGLRTETPQTTAPASNMVGGPGIDPAAPAAPTQTGPSTPAPAATAPAAPASPQIVIGNRIFNSKEDADIFLTNLESRIQTPVAPQTFQPVTEVDPSDILFEDPKKALGQLRSQIKAEIRNEDNFEREKQKVWNDFYKQYPDLKDFEDIVSSSWNRVTATASKSSTVHQVLPNVAAEARKYLERIRGVPSGGTMLTDKPATMAAPSGASLPAVPQQTPQPTNFVEEIFAARRRAK